MTKIELLEVLPKGHRHALWLRMSKGFQVEVLEKETAISEGILIISLDLLDSSFSAIIEKLYPDDRRITGLSLLAVTEAERKFHVLGRASRVHHAFILSAK